MLNSIIRFSLNNRLAILIVSIIVMTWGCITLFKTDVDIFPDLNAPTVVIMTEATGLAPEEVEKMVTHPIETALNGANSVRRVRSSSSAGFSVVWVEFDWGTDTYQSRQIVSEKLSTISGKLPQGCSIPVLGPQSSILGEVMIVALTSDSITSAGTLRSIADRIVAPRLLSLDGVSQVSVLGGDIEEYQISVDPDKMRTRGVTLDQVRNASQGINDNVSGGVIYDYGNEYLIKGDITTISTHDMASSVVKSENGTIVKLSDIASVKIGPKSPCLGKASYKSHDAVLITITKQPDVATIPLTENIDAALAEITPTLPSDVTVSTDVFRQSDFIDNAISNLQISLLEGAFFVIVILFVFLMNARTTIISLLAIPMSVILTIIVMNLLGLSINTMSLGGIAIAIGSLVDDAIVDVENVYRKLQMNNRLPIEGRISVKEVVYQASCEVRMPILNSTLIIIASFLPLFFLTGIEGKLLIPLGISFVVALTASTIIALTLTPVLCSYLLKSSAYSTKFQEDPWLSRKINVIYRRSLPWAITHKKPIIIFTALLLALAISIIPFLGRNFLPSFNEGSLTINVSAPPGVSLEESSHIGNIVENIILSIPEVRATARKTGRAELDEHSLGTNMSEIEATYILSDRSKDEMVSDIRSKLSHIRGVNIEIGQPISHRIDAMLSGTEAQIAIKVFGDDLDELYSIATRIQNSISNINGIVDVNTEQQTERPQIVIKPRRELLARYGITNQQFTSTIGTLLAGEKVSQVYRDGFPYDVTLKLGEAHRSGIEAIGNITIDSKQGAIPLSYVADIISSQGPNTINRENARRRIVISANVDGIDLRKAIERIQETINKDITLPTGYYIKYGGQFENEESASRTLALTSCAAILLILFWLYRQYRSLKLSLIILLNMPLALIGGILILYVTHSELNIPAIIGFISLMGIATRNGMLLISHYIAIGTGPKTSLLNLISRGSADRLNPILMTALSSALALIPLALRGSSPGNEIQSPMAIVILGGLLSSTLLNLYIVPIFYYIFRLKK